MTVLTTVLAISLAQADQDEAYSRHYDGVLGTSLDLAVYGADPERAGQAIDKAVAEISRLDGMLSTYRPESDLMRLNRDGRLDAAPQPLLDVVELCESWWQRSDEKFNCRLGTVVTMWEQAEAEQVLPERPAIRHAARDAINAGLQLDASAGTIQVGDALQLDPSGLAKGYIIDHVLALLRESIPAATGIKVDIGGDAVYYGSPVGREGWQVAVADPVDTADNAGYLATLELASMAVAASGHHSRTREIGRRRFSHILNPRDGWPVENGTAAIVLAPDATTADAVATALSVLPLNDGVSWVDTLDGVEAMVVDGAGRRMHTAGWAAYSAVEEDGGEAGPVLEMSFILPDHKVSSYYRPYVAIWITDHDNKAVKNLLLLGETERWARENTRWWRRVGRRNPALLDGVARPTRGPGEYDLRWDGIDDFGDAVMPGEYILHLEAAREAGGDSYQSLPFTLGGGSRSVQLDADGEFGPVSITFP